MDKNKGFTVVELMVVSSILIVISVIMLVNFRITASNTAARHRVSSAIVADIRKAQSMATTGTNSSGNAVCGYGLQYNNTNSYFIFYKNDAGCTDKKYQLSSDTIIQDITLPNNNFLLQWDKQGSSRKSVYFLSPDPLTFIDGSTLDVNGAAANRNPYVDICVRQKRYSVTCDSVNTTCTNAACTAVTTVIRIYASGQINISN